VVPPSLPLLGFVDAAGAHASPKGSDSIGYLPRVRGDTHENEMLWLVRPHIYYFFKQDLAGLTKSFDLLLFGLKNFMNSFSYSDGNSKSDFSLESSVLVTLVVLSGLKHIYSNVTARAIKDKQPI